MAFLFADFGLGYDHVQKADPVVIPSDDEKDVEEEEENGAY